MSEEFNLLSICGPDLIQYIEGIDLESFVNLQPDQIKELFPNVIHRIMFENRFKNFMKNNPNVLSETKTNSDELTTPIDSSEIGINYNKCDEPIFEEDFGLINVALASSTTPRQISEDSRKTLKKETVIKTAQDIIDIPNMALKIVITKYVGKNEPLENHDRIVVGKAIIQHLLMNNFERKISKPEFIRLTDLIVQLFPLESKGTFYTPAVKGSPAQGKLYSAYQNCRTDLFEAGLIAKKESPSEKEEEEVRRVQVTEKSDALKLVLENNEDFEQIKIAWKVCYNERQKLVSELSTFEYLHKFPAFNLPTGYELLILDADTLYPNKESKLSELASNIVEYGTHLSCKKKATKELKALIIEFGESAVNLESTELQTLQQLMSLRLLPYLMPNPKRKLSRAEVANTFCPYFRTAHEADTFNSDFNAANKNTTLGTKPRLYFIASSPPEARLFIGNNRYIQDAISGFEHLFKSYLALKIPYPDESNHLWQFIQNEIYEIESVGFNQLASVKAFIKDFKHFIEYNQ